MSFFIKEYNFLTVKYKKYLKYLMQATKLTPISTITLLTGNKIPMIGYGTYQLTG